MGPPLWCTAQRPSRRHSAQSEHTSTLPHDANMLWVSGSLTTLHVHATCACTYMCMYTYAHMYSTCCIGVHDRVHRWKGATIPAQKLCSGDWDRTLYFTVWDWNRCVCECVHVCVHARVCVYMCVHMIYKGCAALSLLLLTRQDTPWLYQSTADIVHYTVTVPFMGCWMHCLGIGAWCQLQVFYRIALTCSSGEPDLIGKTSTSLRDICSER